ncbi:MAG: LCP family protein [Mogibacterium sp.]|nr:LCP family protein [Mogibacterium sp.]
MGPENTEANSKHSKAAPAKQKHKSAETRKKRSPRKTIYLLALMVMALAAIGFLVMLILLDMFPKELTLGLIAVMSVLLILTGVLFMSKKKGVRIAGIVTAVIFIAFFASSTALMSSTYAMLNNISADTGVSAPGRVNVAGEPFNVYITGIDQWTKERGQDLERSDVNMIVTVSPQTHKILLTSIPRDAYIVLHRTGTMDKLTHTGVYGVDETLSSVGEWLNLDFDYYVKMNFDACVDIVDAIGGIDVDSPKAFTSSERSKYKYKKGINHLDGKGALYYARERKAFDGEDQLRVRNQLQVMEAVIHKVTTSTTLLTSYGSIMETLGDELETNMPTSDMQKLMKLQLSDMRPWKIETQRMTGTYDMEVVASLDSRNKYSVLKVDPRSLNSCLDKIRTTMSPTEEEILASEEERKEVTVSNYLNSIMDRIRGNGEENTTD